MNWISVKTELPCGECHLHNGETCDICGAKCEPGDSNDEEDPLDSVTDEEAEDYHA